MELEKQQIDNKNILLKMVIIIVIGLLSLKLGDWLTKQGEHSLTDGLMLYTIPVLTVMGFSYLYNIRIRLFCLPIPLSAVMRLGWYILLAGFCLFLMNCLSIPEDAHCSWQQVIRYLLICLLTGLFEEIWCRGLIQNLIFQWDFHKYKSPLYKIMIASCIFGLLHIANLVNRPYFIIGTATQVLYTFSLGMLLGVIYWRSNHLSIPILLHGLFNFLGSFSSIYEISESNAAEGDISLLSALIQLVILLPGIYVAYRLYLSARKNAE